jgi:hypothetical protein
MHRHKHTVHEQLFMFASGYMTDNFVMGLEKSAPLASGVRYRQLCSAKHHPPAGTPLALRIDEPSVEFCV